MSGLPPRLLLCRHGKTAYNNKSLQGVSADRIRGWKNIPLDETGIEDAKKLASRVAQFDPQAIVSSDLSRAEQTARVVARENDLELAAKDFLHDLRPWHVGDLAGQETVKAIPKMKLLAAHPDTRAPGGESFNTFRKRFLTCLIGLLSRVHKEQRTLVAVAHTRNLQMAGAWMTAGAKPNLSVDDKEMNDYEHEVGTGGLMVLAVPGGK